MIPHKVWDKETIVERSNLEYDKNIQIVTGDGRLQSGPLPVLSRLL